MPEKPRKKQKSAPAYSHIFTLLLPEHETERIGKIAGVMRAECGERTAAVLAARLEDAVEFCVKEALRKTPAESGPEEIFEQAVSTCNRFLRKLFESGDGFDPKGMHCAIMSQREREVTIAIWGKPSTLLIQPKAGGAKIFDVLKKSRSERGAERGESKKSPFFSSVISGMLNAGDKFLLSNIDIRAVLGEEKIAELAAGQDTDSAANAIRSAFASAGGGEAAVIAAGWSGSKKPVKKQASAAIQDAAAAETRTLISISLPRRAFHLLKSAAGGAKKALMTIHRTTVVAASRARSLFSQREKAARGRLSEIGGRQSAEGGGKTNFGGKLADALIFKFNALSSRSRLLLIAAATIAAVTSESLAYMNWQKERSARFAAYRGVLEEISQKIDSAEASMLYRDELRARKLLEEAAAAAAKLPEKRSVQRSDKKDIQRKIEDTNNELRRAVKLGAPEEMATFSTNNGSPELIALAKTNNALWAIALNGEIFKVASDGVAVRAGELKGGAAPKIFVSTGSGLIAGDGSASLAVIDAAGREAYKNLDFGGIETSTTDADIYDGPRLYILDASRNRIMKYSALSRGFGKPQHYIKDGTDLSEAVSIAVDGSIYALTRKGEIIKLRGGRREDFAQPSIDPPLNEPKKLITREGWENLYILDGSGRVVVIQKKTAALVAQYETDILKEARDFLVDEKNRLLFAARGNQVLKFELTAAN